jgi:hypothetical protein
MSSARKNEWNPVTTSKEWSGQIVHLADFELALGRALPGDLDEFPGRVQPRHRRPTIAGDSAEAAGAAADVEEASGFVDRHAREDALVDGHTPAVRAFHHLRPVARPLVH